MIGKCPNCSISLLHPPFDNRNTNEVMLTLKYRGFVDSNKTIASMEKKGYCEICDAQLEQLKNQKKSVKASTS
jgi:hypothetical protein|tara:strand:+ start:520 stop:738 length:219 start_codon:yes stop_codon:yes gene_type:complete